MDWKKQVSDFKAALKVESSFITADSIKSAFFGAVGDGKSVTGGICALGLTKEGLIGWIDGESHRSGWAIDQVSTLAAKHYGGNKEQYVNRFKVIHIDPPYHPLRVLAAIDMLEEIKCKCIILDILTQAWDADGGYLDLKNEELVRMAGDDIKKQERSQAAAAAHIKPWTHQKLVNRVNSINMNLVLLFQAKKKWSQESKGIAQYTTPIQESGFTRTSLICGRVEAKDVNGEPQGGHCYFRSGMEWGTKYTHPRILEALPAEGQQFKFEHAEALLRLTLLGSDVCLSQSISKPTRKPSDPLATAKKQLWKMCARVHCDDSKKLEQWLWDENLMSDTESLATLTEDRLKTIIAESPAKLKAQNLYVS